MNVNNGVLHSNFLPEVAFECYFLRFHFPASVFQKLIKVLW